MLFSFVSPIVVFNNLLYRFVADFVAGISRLSTSGKKNRCPFPHGKPVFPFRFTWNIFFKETDVSAPDTVFTIDGRFQGNTVALAFCITYHID